MSNLTDRERAMLEALARIRDFAPTVTHGWADCAVGGCVGLGG